MGNALVPSRLKQELSFLLSVVVVALSMPAAAFFGSRLVVRSVTNLDKWVVLETTAPSSETIVVAFGRKFNIGCPWLAATGGVLVPARLRLHCVKCIVQWFLLHCAFSQCEN